MQSQGAINFNTKDLSPKQNGSEISESSQLNQLVKDSTTPLLKISSIFPFDLFPDDIVINSDKITIIKRQLMQSEWVQSIPITKITDSYVSTTPFFAQLAIIDSGRRDMPYKISFLKRQDAMKAHRIIEGLLIAKTHDINPESIHDPNLSIKMEELGKSKEGV